MEVRALSVDFAEKVARLHRASFDERLPWLASLHTPAEDLAFFRDRVFRDCKLYGAFDGERLIGFIAFREGFIDQLYVLPQSQGRGAGTALLAVAKERFDDLSLWTFQRNAAARRFYERRGFVAVEETDGSANDEKEPDVRYRWTKGGSGSHLFSGAPPSVLQE
jgi:GNAT superfamily N-acetyltransferase